RGAVGGGRRARRRRAASWRSRRRRAATPPPRARAAASTRGRPPQARPSWRSRRGGRAGGLAAGPGPGAGQDAPVLGPAARGVRQPHGRRRGLHPRRGQRAAARVPGVRGAPDFRCPASRLAGPQAAAGARDRGAGRRRPGRGAGRRRRWRGRRLRGHAAGRRLRAWAVGHSSRQERAAST
ncbi:unnamed protein product, partial [Prorocentrum cordatum]